MSPVESQVDLMKSHVTRGVPQTLKSDGARTLQLAVPAGWTVQAKCIGDPRFDSSTGLSAGQAAKLCEGCPVKEQCLSDAMEEERGLSAGNRHTVRGGLSPKERAALDVAARECVRGHSGRWGSHPNTPKPICLECLAEDERERYAARAADPEWRERKNQRMREYRAIQRVSCLECRQEMRTRSFERHLNTAHNDEEQAA